MRRELVWVADWEVQCCGDPFSVGGEIAWQLSPSNDRSWFEEIIGAPLAGEIRSYYDGHADSGESPPRLTSGVVRSIRAVHCRYTQAGKFLSPVPGSAVITPRSSADGWEAETDDVHFVGYLVDLDIAQ